MKMRDMETLHTNARMSYMCDKLKGIERVSVYRRRRQTEISGKDVSVLFYPSFRSYS